MKHGLLSVLLLSVSALAGGCASVGTQDLRVTSQQSGKAYTQRFTEGYYDKVAGGDTDIVLACDTEHPSRRPGHLKQIMHIRVMWNSDRATKWDGAADVNASIRWYVFTDQAGEPEMIEYAGTGQVAVRSEDGAPSIVVHNAQLHPAFNHGQLNDPIGPAEFKGTIGARRDRQRVEDLLSQIRTVVAATSLPQAPVEAKTAEARVAP